MEICLTCTLASFHKSIECTFLLHYVCEVTHLSRSWYNHGKINQETEVFFFWKTFGCSSDKGSWFLIVKACLMTSQMFSRKNSASPLALIYFFMDIPSPRPAALTGTSGFCRCIRQTFCSAALRSYICRSEQFLYVPLVFEQEDAFYADCTLFTIPGRKAEQVPAWCPTKSVSVSTCLTMNIKSRVSLKTMVPGPDPKVDCQPMFSGSPSAFHCTRWKTPPPPPPPRGSTDGSHDKICFLLSSACLRWGRLRVWPWGVLFCYCFEWHPKCTSCLHQNMEFHNIVHQCGAPWIAT